ncbi:E3 ubiquitin-protein ligase rnf8 isoform X1 [Sardina pilchardus]|uniref:E3 ubiquitin-protein ligase rnf8 isoform X1 n=1 Tax=Sardina pilchardus TaxID=27697 RepID=UPI002E146A4E
METTANCISASTEDEDDVVDDEIWCLQRIGRETDWLRLFENVEVTIGRGLDVTHRLLSVTCPLMISRKHCIFKQTASGQWTVTDNMSVNGVWVNKDRIPAGVPHVVEEGNTIWIGVPLSDSPVEYEYTLVRRSLQEVEGCLAKPLCPGVCSYKVIKHKIAKRKRPVDESDVCASPSSKSKLQRSCASNQSPVQRSPLQPLLHPERTPCPAGASQEAGPSKVASLAPGKTLAGSGPSSPLVLEVGSQELESSVRHYSHMQALKEQVEDTQKQVYALEGRLQQDSQREQEVSGLRGQLEVLRGQLRSQQKQALSRMKSLEKTYCDEERRLELEKAQQQEDGLRKQLEQALQEHRKVIEELKNSCQGFEEILQAKDKELEEEKEKAKAQKEEVVTQMTEVLESELQCIICSELFIKAVTLNCAHSFCLHCIRSWRQRKDECPICRQAISSEARSLVLDNCIDRMVEQLSADMKQRRLELIAQRKARTPATPPRRSKNRHGSPHHGSHRLSSDDPDSGDDSSISSANSSIGFPFFGTEDSWDSSLSSSSSSSSSGRSSRDSTSSPIFSSDEDEDEDRDLF